MVDDLGWKDVEFQGSQYYETPNIDKLANEGMVFTNAYANAPNCAPTRASFLSGQYTPRHEIYTVGTAFRGKSKYRKVVPIETKRRLDPGVVTIAELLQDGGYATASIGKWHLGDPPQFGPESQGFDLNIGGDLHGFPPAGYFAPYELPNLEEAPEGEYLTDRLTEEAITFITNNADTPFFLYLPYYSVHRPIQAKEQLVAKYQEKSGREGQNNSRYAAMIESVDQGVGRILAKLDQLGLTRNTLVVFTSDNGGIGGYRANEIQAGELTSQHPLKGGKGMLYEGGIRVPLAVRWPERIPADTISDEPVISLDWFATYLAVAGVNSPQNQAQDGENLLPVLTQSGKLDRKALFWHFPAYLQANKGTWRTTPVSVIRHGSWKLMEFYEDGRLELYNLEMDIGEEDNLAASRVEKREELHSQLKAWRAALDAPVPTKRNPDYKP